MYTCTCTGLTIYKTGILKISVLESLRALKVLIWTNRKILRWCFAVIHFVSSISSRIMSCCISCDKHVDLCYHSSDEYESRNSVKIALYCNISNLHESAWMNSRRCWVTLRFWRLTARLDVLSAADDVSRGCWRAADCVVCILRLSRKVHCPVTRFLHSIVFIQIKFQEKIVVHENHVLTVNKNWNNFLKRRFTITWNRYAYLFGKRIWWFHARVTNDNFINTDPRCHLHVL